MKDETLGDQYEYLEKGVARHLHKVRMNFLKQKLKEIRKEFNDNESIKILDLGCGDGVVTNYIASICKVNDKVFGVDINPIRLERAKKNCQNANFILGDATKLQFSNNSFEVVVLHHIIEHIPNNERVLEECHRVLKEDGYLILGVPNEGGVNGSIYRMIHKKAYKESEHIHFYSSRSMKRLVNENGFNCIENKGFGFLFPFAPIHYIILQNKLLFNIGNWVTQKLRFTADSLFFVAKKNDIFCSCTIQKDTFIYSSTTQL